MCLGTKAVESKILGKFFPGRSKVAAVAKFNQVEKGSDGHVVFQFVLSSFVKEIFLFQSFIIL